MTRTHLIGAVFVMAISAAAAAQAISIPPGLVGPGNASQASNFAGARRHQIVLDRQVVGPGSRIWNSLVLKGDEAADSAGNPIDVSISLACLAVPSPALVDTSSFAANVGLGLSPVVTNRRMTIPAGLGAVITLPFDVPFVYSSGASLLIQLDFVPANVNPTDNFFATLDAHLLPTAFWASTGRTIGTSCHGPGAWQVATQAASDTFTFRYESNGLRPRNLAALCFGASDRFYGGMALPQDFSFLGMPGCVMRASMDTVHIALIAPGLIPAVTVTAPLVRDPNLLGVTVHSQVMMFDQQANAAGLTFSELRSEQLLGAPDPILAMHLWGPISAANPSGVVTNAERNQTLVFTLQ